MPTNYPSNLLDRAKIEKEVLQHSFFKKVRLLSTDIQMRNQELSLRLNLEKHIKEMKLEIYPKFTEQCMES